MKDPIRNRMIHSSCVFAAVLSIALAIRAAAPDCAKENDLDFRIVTDKLSYAPGQPIHVRFIVTNTSQEPLYLFRSLSDCTSQIGSYLFWILDKDNKEVPIQRCSADLIMDERIIDQLTDPKFGIALRQNEIYGLEREFRLPLKKGSYRLKAELWPPGFTDKQKEILSQRQMRVWQSRCPAPVVTITIR